MKFHYGFKPLVFLLIFASHSLFAKNAINFFLDNDANNVRIFGPKSDHHYSSGFGLAFSTRENDRGWGFSLSQQMYTPEDLRRADIIVDDQPYAGWLYGSFFKHLIEEKSLHTFQISLGILGPSSLAEETQKVVHAILNRPRPEGWGNQLRNELTMNGFYQYSYRLFQITDSKGETLVDFIPFANVALGNVFIFAGTGARLRYGYHLSHNFGANKMAPFSPPSPLSSEEDLQHNLECYLFVGGEFRGILRNIFLDGNTLVESHRIDRKNWVWEYEVGLAVRYKNIQAAWRQVVRARETVFDTQPLTFGAFTFTHMFD